MSKGDVIEERLIHSVIGSFYESYNALGFGFLERAYGLALERELTGRSHEVAREVPVLIMYKGEPLLDQRIDMIVDRRLIVEIKSAEVVHQSARDNSTIISARPVSKSDFFFTLAPNQGSGGFFVAPHKIMESISFIPSMSDA